MNKKRHIIIITLLVIAIGIIVSLVVLLIPKDKEVTEQDYKENPVYKWGIGVK